MTRTTIAGVAFATLFVLLAVGYRTLTQDVGPSKAIKDAETALE